MSFRSCCRRRLLFDLQRKALQLPQQAPGLKFVLCTRQPIEENEGWELVISAEDIFGTYGG
ncbi:MAG: hypothetical protein ACREN8_14310 [Candidatus Dormibacteraceae bacterium]